MGEQLLPGGCREGVSSHPGESGTSSPSGTSLRAVPEGAVVCALRPRCARVALLATLRSVRLGCQPYPYAIRYAHGYGDACGAACLRYATARHPTRLRATPQLTPLRNPPGGSFPTSLRQVRGLRLRDARLRPANLTRSGFSSHPGESGTSSPSGTSLRAVPTGAVVCALRPRCARVALLAKLGRATLTGRTTVRQRSALPRRPLGWGSLRAPRSPPPEGAERLSPAAQFFLLFALANRSGRLVVKLSFGRAVYFPCRCALSP